MKNHAEMPGEFMTSHEPKPVSEHPVKETGKIDLRSAYLIFIRAYLRRQNKAVTPVSDEVKHA